MSEVWIVEVRVRKLKQKPQRFFFKKRFINGVFKTEEGAIDRVTELKGQI